MYSDSDSGDDWDEMKTEPQSIKCLFCKELFDSFADALKHMNIEHDFNLADFKQKHALDEYSYIKLINFIRKKNVSPDNLNTMKIKTWENDEYLIPVLEDDIWLMFDIQELKVPVQEQLTTYPVNFENGCVQLTEIHFAELQRTIHSLKAQLEQREIACLLAKQQIDEMVQKVQKIVLEDDSLPSAKNCTKENGYEPDQEYFRSYSHFSIHHEMLSDKVRTESYRDALLMNSHLVSNRIVLDVGCGTGILSMFAAKSGCKKTISVDQSNIIYQTMDIVRENNLSDVITLKKGRLEDIDLAEEKVDIIVSEWMGYFLLFEGMLDTIIYARDHYLAPGGKILPNRCNISIVGSGDTKRYVEMVDYWSNVYGFKMTCMKAEAIREPSIEICNAQELVTSVAEIQSFDLYTVTTDCVNFTADFELIVKKTGSLTALAGYFDIFFDLDNPVQFSTGPHATPTHWKQTVFSLKEPISITEGEILSGKLICRRHVKDARGLMITIQLRNVNQCYYLD